MVKEWVETLSVRRRWKIHLLVISVPMLLVLCGYHPNGETVHLIPGKLTQLPTFVIAHLVIWASCLGFGFLISEIRASELRLPHASWPRTIGAGLLWSVAIRISLLPVALLASRVIGAQGLLAFSHRMSEVLNLENLVGRPVQTLIIYSTLALMAGLMEELWRAGFLAGLQHLFPRAFASRLGTFAMIVITAAFFGLGHLYQGGFGVVITFILGIGLGSILVWRHSYWEAAFAHTAFDATSFALAYHMASKTLLPPG